MRSMIALALLFGVASLFALDIRKSPAEYPVQGSGQDFRIGVEYMVRSFIADEHSFSMDDYLLVEVGVFPGAETNVNLQRFKLRINGKNVLHPQTPGMAAASLKYPDWSGQPTIEAGVTTPDGGGVIVGRRQPVSRFPGDPTRLPPPPPVRGPNEHKPVDYTYVLNRAALSEGSTKRPVAGYIFFPYDGKLKSIRSVELLIDGTPLKLR